MVTELQRKFAKSKILQRLILEQLEPMQDKTRGTWRRAIREVYATMPEPQIKYFLFSLLLCDDITEDERAEVLRLLQISETELTADQLQRIASLLEAD